MCNACRPHLKECDANSTKLFVYNALIKGGKK